MKGPGAPRTSAAVIAAEIITVIVLEDDGIQYGVNGWEASEKDRRLYKEGGADGQD